jgi:uncharacterized protein with HEPN domain
MMDKAGKYLFDIQYAISLIEQFLESVSGFEDYRADIKAQSAVERN